MANQGAVVISSKLPKIIIPHTTVLDYVFEKHSSFSPDQLQKPWLVNVPSGKSITFSQAQTESRKVASALTKMGFKKGDILFFVTYEFVDVFLIQLAVWMLGGAVRGTSTLENRESYTLQMKEVHAKFICVDNETEKNVRSATQGMGDVTFIGLGDHEVEGAVHIKEMLTDDGKSFPETVEIDVQNDLLLICNTSGSTGAPKGVMHTNYTYISNLLMMENMVIKGSIMQWAINYGVANSSYALFALRNGSTMYHINKFDKVTFFDQLLEYKPNYLMVYPFIATWIARHARLAEVSAVGFLKHIGIGGWVLDPTSSTLLSKNLPGAHIQQVYGMSEILFSTASEVTDDGTPARIPTTIHQGHIYTSSGAPLANVEAKVLDINTSKMLKPYSDGLILIRSTSTMKGYLSRGAETLRAGVDSDGWLTTGDVGFYDERGFLYVKERSNFMFKYMAQLVSPSEIESVMQEHPAVLAAGVVGIPHFETNNLTRALVVLKPGKRCTPEELCAFAAKKLPYFKQLHGGAKIVENLPVNKGGKMDRAALKEMALANDTKYQ